MSAPSSNNPGSPSAQPEPDFSLFATFEVPLQPMPELPGGGDWPDLGAPSNSTPERPDQQDAVEPADSAESLPPNTGDSHTVSEVCTVSNSEAVEHTADAGPVVHNHDEATEATVNESARDAANPIPSAPAVVAQAAPIAVSADGTQTPLLDDASPSADSDTPVVASAESEAMTPGDVTPADVTAAEPSPAFCEAVDAVPPVDAVESAVPVEMAGPVEVVSATESDATQTAQPEPVAELEAPVAEPQERPTAPTLPSAATLYVTGSVASSVAPPEVAQADQAERDVSSDQPVAAAEPANGFLPLNLCEEVQAAITSAGYDQPTEIQARTIPHLLEGRDVLAQSQTGSGKTATFALPILSRLDATQRLPQVLVLTPTRELATQVAEAIASYGANVPGFSVAAIYGGQGYETQLRQLKRGVPVVVGTPGRIIDHINRGTLKLNELKTLVLDEADEMLNMGFLDDVKFVLEQTPSERQVALFSATMPPAIRGIAQHYLHDPARITVNQGTMTAAAIRQRAVITAHRDKYDVLVRFLEIEATDGIIVFAKTREATLELAERLDRDGFPAAALNGDLPQRARERTVDQFKAGKLDVLVATDVAARGLDVSRVSHVFNFDVPQDTESYVHRIGRTGRAGRAGEAIILLSRSQKYKLRQIERLTKQAIEVIDIPTADQVNEARVARLCNRISKTIESKDLTRFATVIDDFSKSSGHSADQIAAALAHLSQNGRPFFVQDLPTRSHRSERHDHRSGEFGSRNDGPGRGRHRDRADDRDRSRRDRGGDQERRPSRNRPVPAGMDRYRIEVGHDDGVKPGNIVGAIANEGGIEGQYIGPINIFAGHSTIDLPEGMPSDVQQTLHQIRVAGKQLRLRPATSADSQQDSGFRKRRHGSGGPSSGGRRFSKGKPAGKYRSKKRDR